MFNNSPDKKQLLEKEVLASFHSLFQAYQSLDSDKYFNHFDHENFSGLNADGTVWRSFNDFQPLIASSFPMLKKVISLDFSNVKVTILNPTSAILVNEYQQSMQLTNGQVINQSGGGSQVWHKSNNQWKLVSVSASQATN